eukprot:scaffold17576_cov66-Phaeocystis_antarctica.AAC.2
MRAGYVGRVPSQTWRVPQPRRSVPRDYTPPTAAKSMPPTRLSLRLGQLPHDVLAELAAKLCSESPALQATANKCIAAHNPLPPWAVERVLLSPDLMPHILGPLVAEDGAAAAVCSQWLAGWKATNEPRRRLKRVPLDFPEELDTRSGQSMAATPDGRLVVNTGTEMHILDRSMHVLQTLPGVYYDGFDRCFAANDDSIYHGGQALHRSSHAGTLAAEYQLEGYDVAYPVLAPGGLVFCVRFFEDEGDHQNERDEIIVLDAQTLQFRHRFGLGLLNDANQLAVGGDELYVCDTGNHRLQVFSLTGEHRRSVMGEWRSPESLCCVKDRLYLVERDPIKDEDYDEDKSPLQARRILVLSLQGDILQVVTHLTEPTAEFTSICCTDHKLLASYNYTESAGTPRSWIIALHGL